MNKFEKTLIEGGDKKELDKFEKGDFYQSIEIIAKAIGGRVFFNPEDIEISTGSEGPVFLLKQPKNPTGTKEFFQRMKAEQNFPKEIIINSVLQINKILNGELHLDQIINPEFKTSIAFSIPIIYEDINGNEYIDTPIIPNNPNQKFPGALKIYGSSVIRAGKIPNKEIIQKDTFKEKNSFTELEKKYNEKLITKLNYEKIGIWNIKIQSGTGKIDIIPGCNIFLDPETGTFEIISARKMFINENIEHNEFKIENTHALNLHGITDKNQLAQKKEGDSVKFVKLFNGKIEIKKPEELPENYRDIIKYKNGYFWQKSFKTVPSLKYFLQIEKQKIGNGKSLNYKKLNEIKDENKLILKQEQETRIRNKIAETTEKIGEELFGENINEEFLKMEIPENFLEKISDQAEKFQNYVKNNFKIGDELKIKPDFILENGDFIEVKSGRILDEKQLFKMVLWKILNLEDINSISYLSLEHDGENEFFPEIKYKNIYKIQNKGIQTKIENIKIMKEFLKKISL